MRKKVVCQNKTCASQNQKRNGRGRTYVKKGYYTAAHRRKPIPRYQCKLCGTRFSATTDAPTARQSRPDIDEQIFHMFCSGMTKRRIARTMRVTVETVANKLARLARRARELQIQFLGRSLRTRGYFQYDELETYLWTK